MARNNSKRLGVGTGGTDTPTPPIMDVNQEVENNPSPLSFVVPTEYVDLPSKGQFYPENHPLYMVDTIEIRHMTAKDEDILTSRTLLKKGVALDKFLQNIVVDKKIDISRMFLGDKNALIVASRISGYGSRYETKVACPACLVNVEHTFNLNEANLVSTDDIDLDELGAKATENGTFIIALPAMKISVEARLLNGVDEKEITRLTEQNKKKKRIESLLTIQLKRLIVSVNGDEARTSVDYVVDNMPASDARYLRKTYQALTPTIDLTQDFECSECGYEQEMEVPFTADFFWPDR